MMGVMAHRPALRVVVPLLVAALLLLGRVTTMPAVAGVDGGELQLPDLVPLHTSGVRLGVADDNVSPALRFHTVTANRGGWALDILSGDVDPDSGAMVAEQCVRWTGPTQCADRQAVGELYFVEEHRHTHFDDYALQELRHLLPDGSTDMSPAGLAAPNQKASFCLLDSAADGTPPAAEFDDGLYTSCGAPGGQVRYGISPGWRDVYTSPLEGQQIPIEGVADGDYDLVVTIDAENKLHESDDGNNRTSLLLRLSDEQSRVTTAPRFDGDLFGDAGDPRAAAIELCREAFPGYRSADRVVLARHDVFADALAGAPLAGDSGCVLFTTGGPGQPLDPATAAELSRAISRNAEVLILGGPAAVSAEVEQTLVGSGYDVLRLAGDSRYETAARIAGLVQFRNPARATVLLANAGTYADAITAGAYAAFAQLPILLTDADGLHPATATALDELNVSRTIVLGGPAAVSEAIAEQTTSPRRIAGTNRMGTAVEVARQLWGDEGIAPTRVVLGNVETADGWAFALAASPLAARLQVPVLGTGATGLPSETASYLADLDQPLERLDLLGAAEAVPVAVALTALDAAP